MGIHYYGLSGGNGESTSEWWIHINMVYGDFGNSEYVIKLSP